MSGVSFAVPSFNEAEALERMVRSSLPFASLIDEWVIVDHRSEDNTQEVIEGLRALLREHKIGLRTVYESRDFSKDFMMADLRNLAADTCSHDVVVQVDADFVFGPAFPELLARGVMAVASGEYDSAGYAVPVIWDHLRTSKTGRIKDHGRVWVHWSKPSIFRRDLVHRVQTAGGGKWAALVRRDGEPRRYLRMTARFHPLRHSVVSVNIKPPERLELRLTMNSFQQDCVQEGIEDTWLESHKSGATRQEKGKYKYRNVSLRGWKTYAPRLRLGYASELVA